jgi:hypothetical protein
VVANRAVRRGGVYVAAVFAALATPAVASAHSRAATVALDYRLPLDPGVKHLHGVTASVLDGDRSLKLTAAPGVRLVVLGDLGEPMLRFGNGVWVNQGSPTAEANRLVVNARKGWHRVAGGRSFSWHEHRLSPPPFASGAYGPVARWSVPVLVDGRRTAVSGSFWRVRRPPGWAWLAATVVAAAAAVAVLRQRRRIALPLTVGAGSVAVAAALVAQTAFALRDSPAGRISWVPIIVGALVAAVVAWLVVAGRGSRRGYAAGAVGAGVAALTLSWVGVFFHGVVVAALPATPVRLACAAALAGGVVSLVGALSLQLEDA